MLMPRINEWTFCPYYDKSRSSIRASSLTYPQHQFQIVPVYTHKHLLFMKFQFFFHFADLWNLYESMGYFLGPIPGPISICRSRAQRDGVQGRCANHFGVGFVECIDQRDEATNLIALLRWRKAKNKQNKAGW